MQLVLGKKHLGNERIYRKRMFAKSRIEIEILENLRKPLTRKSMRKCIDIDFKRVSFIYTLARLIKIENIWFAQVAQAMRFHVKFHLKNAIRAISVFRVKFNVEFTCQAVNFSIILQATSIVWSQCLKTSTCRLEFQRLKRRVHCLIS